MNEHDNADSILNSVKKLLGITEEYTVFDMDLIIHINSVFMILNQLGVGPEKPFTITDAEGKWSDFIGEVDNIESVKTYLFMKVRMLFDPPQSSAVIEATNNLIREMEWRLNVAVDPKEENLNGYSY